MNTLSRTDFSYIRDLVYKHCSIVLEADKQYLVESRLAAVTQEQGLSSLQALLAQLRTQPNVHVLQKVIEAITINETFFFRDGHPFEALKNYVLPQLSAKLAPGRKLNIWCAACSSGQEPFSIAMLIHEHFPDLANGRLRIFATDLSNEVLWRAIKGCYSQLEVSRGLPPAFLMKYFEKHELGWQIRAYVRNRVEFHQANLAGTWPAMPSMDIIFMRNILIYFDVETKKRILSKARQLLKPGGYLFLGTSETMINLDESFERVVVNKSTCYKVRDKRGKQLIGSLKG